MLRNGYGFSLVEVMVVLFLVALIAAVTVPATGRFFDSLAGRRKEGAILANFRYARLMAIESGRQITATVGDEGRELRFEGGLQETRDLGFTDEEILSMEPGAVVFYPEGMATVATVTFSGGRRTASWWIEPLTGLPVAVPVEPR
ncbi:MAG: prepilin-type N-terminal cleavage/methylation domain-containing protein [Thermodesulfobacteriota bacterium]